MAAKRKYAKRGTGQRQPSTPESQREWNIVEALKDDPLFQEIAQELLHPKEISKEDKILTDIGDFLDSLCDPSGESEDESEFEKRWEQFLRLNVALAQRQLIRAGVPKDRLVRLIVSGWACFDEKSGDIRFRFGPPLDGGKAVLVIPSHVEAAVWQHPTIRTAAGKNEYMGWKERVERRLKWAASLADDGDSSRRLRELSDAITSMLHVSAHTEPAEKAWISSAIQSERFWAILAHAVDFGIHQNALRLFMDGKLLGAAQQSALNEKIKHLSWYLIIDEAIRETFAETGRIQTPSELRKLFGLEAAPGSEKVILEFPDPRFRHHGEITWGPFKKYAKQAGKIGSDDRTQ
jgi:hypothetical protein